MLINLDSTTLETFLKRAASSSRLGSYLDAHAAAAIVRPIAANVDKIVTQDKGTELETQGAP